MPELFVLFAVLGIGAVVVATIAVVLVHTAQRKKRLPPSVPVAGLPARHPATPPPSTLLARFTKAKRQAYLVATCKPYVKLFGGLALPIQLLLGIAHSTDDNDPVFLQDFLYERVIRAISSARQRAGFQLSPSGSWQPPLVEPPTTEDAQVLEEAELLNRISRYESIYQGGAIDLAQKQAVSALFTTLAKLEQIREDSLFDPSLVCEMAREVVCALEAQHIYPLYHNDSRLAQRPDLQGRFSPAPAASIRYPGLFWEHDGTLVVLGSCIGTK